MAAATATKATLLNTSDSFLDFLGAGTTRALSRSISDSPARWVHVRRRWAFDVVVHCAAACQSQAFRTHVMGAPDRLGRSWFLGARSLILCLAGLAASWELLEILISALAKLAKHRSGSWRTSRVFAGPRFVIPRCGTVALVGGQHSNHQHMSSPSHPLYPSLWYRSTISLVSGNS